MIAYEDVTVWHAATPEPVAARIAIGGDFLPAGNLIMPPEFDWGKQAKQLDQYFKDVGTTFVNLEGTLDTRQLRPRALLGLGQIVSAPPSSLEYLKSIRCGAIGIANNHSCDFGDEGVAHTKAASALYDMVSIGAGITLKETPDIFVWRGPDTMRVGFWAAAKATSDQATANRRGVEPCRIERGTQALETMRSQGAQCCVALIHAGCMRNNQPDPEDVRLLESLAQSGFDIVAASHSHRIAGHKQLRLAHDRNAFCFFGLGSIVSGYVSSPLEREGLVIVASLNASGGLVALEIHPVLLDAAGFGSIPSESNREIILQRFRKLSAELADGSYEKHFYRETSTGLTRLYVRDAQAAFRAAGLRGLARKAARVRVRHMKRLIRKVTG